jgi:hypothetical protein
MSKNLTLLSLVGLGSIVASVACGSSGGNSGFSDPSGGSDSGASNGNGNGSSSGSGNGTGGGSGSNGGMSGGLGSGGGNTGGAGGSGGTGGTGGTTNQPAEVWGHSPDTLYKVDPTTKAVTVIGQFQGCTNVIDLALDKMSNMYVTTQDALYSIDKTTATCTHISDGNYPNSLSFVPAGTLDPSAEALVGYVGDTYVRIDTTSGNVTNVGSLSAGSGVVSSGDIVSVIGGPSYLTVTGGSNCSSNDCLIEVDPQDRQDDHQPRIDRPRLRLRSRVLGGHRLRLRRRRRPLLRHRRPERHDHDGVDPGTHGAERPRVLGRRLHDVRAATRPELIRRARRRI